MATIDESILTSIKGLLGPTEEDTSFDPQIILHINSVFSRLHSLGIGPTDSFIISDKSTKWSAFLGSYKNMNDVKTYVYLKVKKVFDPPTSSTLLQALNESIAEYEALMPINEEEEESTI